MSWIGITRRKHRQVVLSGLAAMLLSSCVATYEAPPEPQPFTIAQICDPHLGRPQKVEAFELAVAKVNTLDPDLVVICGDLVYRPEETAFHEFNKIKAGLEVPCYCVPGNHDVLDEGYERKNGISPQASLANYRKTVGKDYYSFEHKGYMFICVNTQLWKIPVKGESWKHDKWFKAALKAAAKRQLPILVVGHYPLYLKQLDEAEGYFSLPADKRKELLDLFVEHGVVAYLSGHAHKTIVNEYKGVQLVTGQNLSHTSGAPLGFMVWRIEEPRPFKHEFIGLDNADK